MTAHSRSLCVDIVFTVLLLGAFLLGSLYLPQATSAQPLPPVAMFLIATLMPGGAVVLLSVIERLLPPQAHASPSEAGCSTSRSTSADSKGVFELGFSLTA